MNTLNTNESLPEYFYLFLHSDRMWHLKWNFKLTKTLTSASITNTSFDMVTLNKYIAGEMDYIPFLPNPSLDMKSPSSFSLREVSDYMVDYNAELFRKQHEITKKYPSRFGCLYAFGSLQDAQKAAEEWNFNMNDLHKFKLKNIGELTRVVKVNMQIVSQMWNIGTGTTFDQQANDIIWEHYWSGKAELPLDVPDLKTGEGRQILNYGVIWEYLIDGQLELIEQYDK